jgi:polyphosphate glucokinase
MSATAMVEGVLALTRDWQFDVVSIGYPGVVKEGRPQVEPRNLGDGWTTIDFEAAFGKPVKVLNDAAMQALGSYAGGRMLFLGLGTGLGTAIVSDGRVEPLEIAHLPYRKQKSYEEYLGEAGFKRLGKSRWAKHVAIVCDLMRHALLCDYVILGGGNVRRLDELPPHTRRGSNEHAVDGGVRLWAPDVVPMAVPTGEVL